MGLTATIIPTITPDQFASRMCALFPPGWASAQAKLPSGAVYEMLKSIGTGPSSAMDSLAYAAAATRLQTAVGDALDIASVDYFGDNDAHLAPGLPDYDGPIEGSGLDADIYAIWRLRGEGDAAYRARLMAALLPTGATRPAVTAAVQATSGYAPRVVEPWRPADTGVWDPALGAPMSFWDVDTPNNPFRWTDQSLAYQGFVNAVLPSAQPFGNNPTPCLDTVPFFWDVPNQFGIYFIDPPGAAALGAQTVYNAINRTKCEGTVVWVQFVAAPPAASWDQPGISWDQSGVVWQ